MRPFSLSVAIAFVLACAPPPPVVHSPLAPPDAPLEVRLHQPIGDVIHYSLSEPAYVALFAVTRGQGVRLVFPYFESQVAHRGHAGLNQETLHGGNRTWGYASASLSDQGGRWRSSADAYFIIASREPLPLEGILQSPYLLRSLLGDDAYRATSFSRTWSALANVLAGGLPEDAWSSDVFLTLRNPFIYSAGYEQEPIFKYCRRSFYVPVFAYDGLCRSGRLMVATTPPIPAPAPTVPVRRPPDQPRDRDPSVPFPPDGGVIRTSRSGDDSFAAGRPARESEASRNEMGRAEAKRAESARVPERQVEQPTRRESKRPKEPPRDN